MSKTRSNVSSKFASRVHQIVARQREEIAASNARARSLSNALAGCSAQIEALTAANAALSSELSALRAQAKTAVRVAFELGEAQAKPEPESEPRRAEPTCGVCRKPGCRPVAAYGAWCCPRALADARTLSSMP